MTFAKAFLFRGGTCSTIALTYFYFFDKSSHGRIILLFLKYKRPLSINFHSKWYDSSLKMQIQTRNVDFNVVKHVPPLLLVEEVPLFLLAKVVEQVPPLLLTKMAYFDAFKMIFLFLLINFHLKLSQFILKIESSGQKDRFQQIVEHVPLLLFWNLFHRVE